VPGTQAAAWLDFEAFVREYEPRLSRALAAAYGFEDGRDATAEALAYAWENWDRLQDVTNLPGYLFRVGQTRNRRNRKPGLRAVPGHPAARPAQFEVADHADRAFEPGLPAALAGLSHRQRIAVVLVHGYGYTLREVADLTGVRATTVQNHLARGLARLRASLGVTGDQ
jgi:RNA polymerase sigma factor (sigma-70 family)